MPQPNIKGIIWDFGNILAKFDHRKACTGLAQYSPLSSEAIFEKLFSDDASPARSHESGRITPDEFFLELRRVLSFDQNLSFEAFVSLWSGIFSENTGLEALLDKVRPEIKQCVMSNTDPIHWQAIARLPVMRRYFSDANRLVRSYIVGARKPDKKIYHAALKCLGLSEGETSQVLFIEDVLEYREVFERMGGNTLAYDCSRDPLARLESGLQGFGVLR